jgi:hypothetical protein
MSWSEVLTVTDRVRAHTAPDVQARLDEALAERVANCRAAGGGEIAARLDDLDREWDIERVLEVSAATITAASVAAGAVTRRRGVLLLPLAVALFLLQHGLQGWCPPLAIFRRREVRTRREIDLERYALKALRGDFTGGTRPDVVSIDDLLETAARR